MKHISLFVLMFISITSLYAQIIEDSVILEAGYANQSYYSLVNGEVANEDNNNWDLAFDVSSFGSSIHINDHAGAKLYLYPSGDTSAWATVDTTGVSSWPVLFNSDTSWGMGAFDRTIDAGNPEDLGWGTYNTITHSVTGDSIYVMQLSSGNWKKLWIKKLAGGSYSFRYANLNGSNDVTKSLAKGDYSDRNFGYYSIQTETERNREPANNDWDIVFTKYVSEVAPGMPYGVTGVLMNYGVSAARVYPVNDPFSYSAHGSHNRYETINTIGYDWKYFDMSSFTYVVEDSLCYFVQDVPGNIWRVTFTGFAGSSTGKIVFSREMVAEAPPIGIEENGKAAFFNIYPNPATSLLNVITDVKGQAELNIFDMTGKMVSGEKFSSNGLNTRQISLEGLNEGVYIIQLNAGNSQSIQKLIIRN